MTPGEVLDGRYTVVRIIAEGGMSTVAEVRDQRLPGRLVAKRMKPSMLACAEAEQLGALFRREAEVLSKLSHPYLPKVTDYFECDGQRYLVEELVEGQTLEAWAQQTVQGGDGLRESRVVGWAIGICQALQYLHDHGIIYRDLKPSNVMITPEGDAVVLDFGLAADLSAGPLPEPSPVGTAKYASPEQVRGEPATARSDLYSFGVLAREVYARTYKKAIPRAIEEVLARATAEAPEARVESARELRDALAKVVARRRLLSQIRRSAKSLFSL